MALIAIVFANSIVHILNMLFGNVIIPILNILFRVTLSCRSVFGILRLVPSFVHSTYMSSQATFSICRIFAMLTLVPRTLWQYAWVGWVYFHCEKVIKGCVLTRLWGFSLWMFSDNWGWRSLVKKTLGLGRLTANNVTVVALADRNATDAMCHKHMNLLIGLLVQCCKSDRVIQGKLHSRKG